MQWRSSNVRLAVAALATGVGAAACASEAPESVRYVVGAGVATTAGCTEVTFSGQVGTVYTLFFGDVELASGTGWVSWSGDPTAAGSWRAQSGRVTVEPTRVAPNSWDLEGCTESS
jgi:hypothetical protein